jgi:hypothetical protein
MGTTAPPQDPSSNARAGAIPQYFLTTLIIFWLPAFFLGRALRKRLSVPEKRALRSTILLLALLTFLMELIYRRLKIWTFSEEVDPLLGVRVAGEPVEEFSFWAGATPFMMTVYLLLRSRRRRDGGDA